MLNRSGSILTRGKASSTFYRTGVTPFTSGFIMTISEETLPSAVDGGGRSGYSRGSGMKPTTKKEEEKKLKRITVTVYINNEEFKQSCVVQDDIKVTTDNVIVEWTEQEKPIIRFKGLL